MSEEKRADGLDSPFLLPYLSGVYLATNAIADAFLLVDGPNCVFFRIAQTQGNHDWLSTLASSDGLHRVADTDCTTERAAAADNRLLLERLRRLDELEGCRLILLGSMASVAVTGPQYERLLKSSGPWAKPVTLIPAGSLRADWLGGYAAVLEALAGKIELERGKSRQGEVASVGHLWDRNEGDQRANLAEMSRLLAGLGLKLGCCWLEGRESARLGAIGRAGTILSFPYGSQAAAKIAERTGARLVECDLPLGLEATSAWLRRVGAATGREKQAERVVESELAAVVPQIEFLLLRRFLHRQVALLGNDPFLLTALERMSKELGLEPQAVLVFSATETVEGARGKGRQAGDTWLVNPGHEEAISRLHALALAGELDAVIANSRVLSLAESLPGRIPFVEFGFPSYHTHFFSDSPWLGYRGALKIIERTANVMAYESCRRQADGGAPQRW